MDERLRVIVVAPGEPAVAKEIDGSLNGLQAQVGGNIEALYPFDDKVGIVCNDEAKLMGMEPNRAMRTEDGDVYDIICGNFLVAGLGVEDFQSLTPEQEQKYLDVFKFPERFVMKDGQIKAIPMTGKMDFEVFRTDVIAELDKRFAADGINLTMVPQRIDKPNGSYEGISIMIPDTTVSLSVNLEQAYEHLNTGNFEPIVNNIYESVRTGIDRYPRELNANKVMDYSWAKDHMAVEVISTELTGDFVKHVPHQEVFGDLAAVYRIQISDEASTLITNNMLKAYGVSQEQLHADALASSEKNFPVNIQPMSSVLGAAMGQDVPDEGIGLYVCSSDNRMRGGAGVVAYSDFADKAGEKIHGDFFILPSSIHEVLIIPDSGLDRLVLEEMVNSINETELQQEDILSDNVYHYDAADRKLELAQDFEARKQNQTAKKNLGDVPKRKGR